MSKNAQFAAVGGALLLVAAALSQIGKSLQSGETGTTLEVPDFSKYLAGIGSTDGGAGDGFKNKVPDTGKGGDYPLPPHKPVPDEVTIPVTGTTLTREHAQLIIKRTIDRHGFNVDPEVAGAICMVESAGRADAIGDVTVSTGPAWGLMQVLRATAQWLHDDMGYGAYPATETSLLTPEGGAYYGCAYLDYLASYNGVSRERNWIIQSYNAGPGNGSSRYLNKVLAELNRGRMA